MSTRTKSRSQTQVGYSSTRKPYQFTNGIVHFTTQFRGFTDILPSYHLGVRAKLGKLSKPKLE
jgi:hypothetical protein